MRLIDPSTLEDLPTIDAEPVVRCRDCISFDASQNCCSLFFYVFHHGNGFCHLGMRKNGYCLEDEESEIEKLMAENRELEERTKAVQSKYERLLSDCLEKGGEQAVRPVLCKDCINLRTERLGVLATYCDLVDVDLYPEDLESPCKFVNRKEAPDGNAG